MAATTHSQEGLNDMVYNRCIGIRYCGNNCPYKVRRLNFFNYHKDMEDPANEVLKMAYNPEVTVRCRGVMEKCTYCIQRIQAAKIEAKNHRRASPTARSGPPASRPARRRRSSSAIWRPAERVAKLRHSPRAYNMLAELNIKPRTSYW